MARVPAEAHGQLTRALDIRRRHEHVHVGHGPQTRIAVEARDQGQSLEDDGIDAGLLEGLQQGKNAVVEALVLAPGEEVSLLEGIDPLVAVAEADEVPVHERKQRLGGAVQRLERDRGADSAPGGTPRLVREQRRLQQ